ncbi:MAG TPA: hypothetical protein VKP30_21015 [Polyangiaceae bacterium]|nr:hypothetical protein [Polyangiaceae bacterium]
MNIHQSAVGTLTLIGCLTASLISSCSRAEIIAVSEAQGTSGRNSISSVASGGGSGDTETGGGTGNGTSMGGGSSRTSSTAPSIGGTSGACALNLQPCAESSNCCSENCVDGKCAARPACYGRANACDSPEECCSGICSAGRCLDYPGCALIGEPCTSNSECCSTVCADGGAGERTCQALDGCRTLGERCTKGGSDGECCSGTCTTDVATGLKRCDRGTDSSCLHAGELCDDHGGTPCCDGPPTQVDPRNPYPQVQPAICFPTAVGRTRCLVKSPDTCFEPDSPCRLAGECCVFPHYCTPSLAAGNPLTCKLERTIEQLIHAPCRASRDCRLGEACFGIGGLEGVCKPTGLDCRQLGQTCADATGSCCDGRCATESAQTCVVSD